MEFPYIHLAARQDQIYFYFVYPLGTEVAIMECLGGK